MDSSAPRSTTILITGLTGYIGSWIGRLLLDQHGTAYKIRATVRSAARIDTLREAFSEAELAGMEFVEANLNDPASLAAAVKGCQYMIHAANPIPSSQRGKGPTEREQIQEVEESMQAIIEAAVATKMRRLVVTSSFAAIAGGLYKKDTGNPVYSEEDFPPTEGADFYAVGKIL